jgi:hypothetical protein
MELIDTEIALNGRTGHQHRGAEFQSIRTHDGVDATALPIIIKHGLEPKNIPIELEGFFNVADEDGGPGQRGNIHTILKNRFTGRTVHRQQRCHDSIVLSHYRGPKNKLGGDQKTATQV